LQADIGMDVFYVFQRRVTVRFDRLETVGADALFFRSARDMWLCIGRFLAAHNGTSEARRRDEAKASFFALLPATGLPTTFEYQYAIANERQSVTSVTERCARLCREPIRRLPLAALACRLRTLALAANRSENSNSPPRHSTAQLRKLYATRDASRVAT
jgi:hypothetical protein